MTTTISDRRAEYDDPIIVVSDGGPITITETSHEDMIAKIRTWMDTLYTSMYGANTSANAHELHAMGAASITLLEVDASTGISLEDFGPVGTLVSRVVAHAYGHDPRYTTVHWHVA